MVTVFEEFAIFAGEFVVEKLIDVHWGDENEVILVRLILFFT